MWDRGLNTAALKDYQTLLFDRIDQLVSALRRESTPKTRHVDLARWVAFFTLDFMGDLAWGGVFNSMKEGVDAHGIIDLSRFITRVHETAGTIPWMKQVFKHLPVSKQTEQHSNFAKSIILERMNRGPTQTSDLFGNLIGESDTSSEPLSLTTLVHETSLALIAGTDTSAVTLANVFFYLLSYPDSLRRLQAELELASSTSAGKGTNYLAGLHYLNAVINETMRLQPVVPNGVQRVLIPGPSGQGEVVNDRYIPPRTNLQISTHCVHRDSENFSPHPDGFWPDRWLPDIQATLQEAERESFRLNEQAFFPFSYGPTGCAGKALALMEMRAVISAVLTNFDLAFADGWDPSEWECSLKDFYTMRGGPLKVVLTPRQKS
ncbi:hypothetical protein PQX77_014880 [Marasmius sp. AFHP31]|nr:hypothetical protein PQX77_014880 [Marasmius sp. AFHP31]